MQVSVLACSKFIKAPDGKSPRHDQLVGSDLSKIIECAGRICYDSFGSGRSSNDFCKHILEVDHGSVLEHASITFHIRGISRACSHELVRHRVGIAISQRSSRYCNEQDSAFAEHPVFKSLSSATRDEIEQLYLQSKDLYEKVYNELKLAGVDHKSARGASRFVLPHSLQTELIWTANIRALRHVIKMRASPFADPEIRELAKNLFDAALPYCPEYLEDLKSLFVTTS